MRNGVFALGIQEWVESVKEANEVLAREAVEELLTIANAGQPEKTGMLKGSLSVAVDAEPPAVTSIRSPSAWKSELAGITSGSVVKARWTAFYSYMVEMGTSRTPARGAVRLAVQQWPAIMQRTSNRVRSAFGL